MALAGRSGYNFGSLEAVQPRWRWSRESACGFHRNRSVQEALAVVLRAHPPR